MGQTYDGLSGLPDSTGADAGSIGAVSRCHCHGAVPDDKVICMAVIRPDGSFCILGKGQGKKEFSVFVHLNNTALSGLWKKHTKCQDNAGEEEE